MQRYVSSAFWSRVTASAAQTRVLGPEGPRARMIRLINNTSLKRESFHLGSGSLFVIPFNQLYELFYSELTCDSPSARLLLLSERVIVLQLAGWESDAFSPLPRALSTRCAFMPSRVTCKISSRAGRTSGKQ